MEGIIEKKKCPQKRKELNDLRTKLADLTG
jgi:hypothetical protein